MNRIDEIFDISRGNKLDYNKMDPALSQEDGVAFVNRSGEKNGFAGFVQRIVNIEPYEAGLITVALGGSALSSFVQPFAFYTAQNVDVLRPKMNMSISQKLYYCKCIELNRYRYSTFGREANRTLHKLLVPSLSELPSWLDSLMDQAVETTVKEFQGLPGVMKSI